MRAGIDDSFGRDRVLVHCEDSGVLEVLEIDWVEVSEVDAEQQGRRSQSPEAQLGLTFIGGQAVVAAIAELDGVIVVETSRTGVGLPVGNIVEAFRDILPTC